MLLLCFDEMSHWFCIHVGSLGGQLLNSVLAAFECLKKLTLTKRLLTVTEHGVTQPPGLGTSSLCWWTWRSEMACSVCERQFRFSSMARHSPPKSGGRMAGRERSGPAYSPDVSAAKRKMSSFQSRRWTDSPLSHQSLSYTETRWGGIIWIWIYVDMKSWSKPNACCFVSLKTAQRFLKKWEYYSVPTSSQYVNRMFNLPCSSGQQIQLHPLHCKT